MLELREVPPPAPGPGEVLVGVAAAGLNFADILVCQGRYQHRPPLPFTPGLECAGTVLELGDGVTGIDVGRRVAASSTTGMGAFAEQVVVPAGCVVPVPDSVGFADAASLLVNYGTGWHALHDRARIANREWLLVHAGAGGVGSAAIQLGRAAGARVIATAGGADKAALCEELGAEVAVDYRADDFVAVVKEVTGAHGADVVYDPVGGEVFDGSRRCVAWDGRILVIGFASGQVPEVPLNHVLVKSYGIVGVHFGGAAERDPTLLTRIGRELVALHATGTVDPHVFAEVAFAELPAALELLGARGTTGKVVVSVA